MLSYIRFAFQYATDVSFCSLHIMFQISKVLVGLCSFHHVTDVIFGGSVLNAGLVFYRRPERQTHLAVLQMRWLTSSAVSEWGVRSGLRLAWDRFKLFSIQLEMNWWCNDEEFNLFQGSGRQSIPAIMATIPTQTRPVYWTAPRTFTQKSLVSMIHWIL